MSAKTISLACFIALITIAGCGGSSKPLTKQQYIAQGDAVCQKLTTETANDLKTLNRVVSSDPSQAVSILDRVRAKFVDASNKFAAVKPPANDQHVAGEIKKLDAQSLSYLDQLRTFVQRLEKLFNQAATVGQSATPAEKKRLAEEVKSLETDGQKIQMEATSHGEKVKQFDRAYGFKVCGTETTGLSGNAR